jgi:uncharacterized protein
MGTPYQPLQLNERVEILDLLRGIALLGILMVNMPLMNAPFITEMGDFAIWRDPANKTASWIIKFFFTGKFYTLFSMLFGIGFYFFLRKANDASLVPLFRRRLGWLLAFGVMHVVLLWYGDILVFYALFGFLLIPFRKKSNRSLIIWAVCILFIPVVLSTLFVFLMKMAQMSPQGAAEMEASLVASNMRMSELLEQALIVYPTGSFAEIVQMRLMEYQNILGGIFFFFPNVLAMFLVGVVLARKKVFEDLDANKEFFKKLLLYSLPFALVGNWLYATYASDVSYIDMDWVLVLTLVGHGFGGPAMTFVYIALIAHVFHKGYFRPLTYVIAKTGRMALTNYLSQSIIATTIFFSYGLGMYGRVNIWQGMILTVAIYVVQVIWSYYWLQHFRYGPMEWLWRTLTYGKKQKMHLPDPNK